MYHTPVTKIVVRCFITIGVALTLLLAGGAPVDFTHQLVEIALQQAAQ